VLEHERVARPTIGSHAGIGLRRQMSVFERPSDGTDPTEETSRVPPPERESQSRRVTARPRPTEIIPV
jgi:hypothetical protein